VTLDSVAKTEFIFISRSAWC